MFYVSKILNQDLVEVTNTIDNISEVVLIDDLIQMNNVGETIIGIDRDGLWADYDPETAVDIYYSGDKISSTGSGVPVWICYWDGLILKSQKNRVRSSLVSEEYKCIGAQLGLLKGVLTAKDFEDMILKSKDDFSKEVSIMNFWEEDIQFYKDNLYVVTPFLTDSNCFEISSLTKDNFTYLTKTIDGNTDVNLSYCYTFPDYMQGDNPTENIQSDVGFGTDDRTVFKPIISKNSSGNKFKTASIKTNLHSSMIQSYIHQHFVLKDTGKVFFLVINTAVGEKCPKELYSEWEFVDVYALANSMSGREAEKYREQGVSEDDLIKNGFISNFYNASFHDNVIEYTNQSGTYRFEIDKYTEVSRNYVDMQTLSRSCAALALLHRDPSHVDERGTVDYIRINEKGIVTIPDGAVTMAFNCRFNTAEAAVYDTLLIKELVFPRTFKRVLDYIGLLKGYFNVMESGKSGAPVKITVKGEPDEFLKSYMK